MDYLPLFFNLRDKPVLVVGGGDVAKRKIALLRQAQARVLVVAHTLCDEIQQQVQENQLIWLAKKFDENQLDNAYFTIAATNDPTLNQRIFQAASQKNRPVNSVDDLAHCDMIFPSIIDRSPVQIAISSSGVSPVLIRLLREKLESLLPQHISVMAQIAQKWRNPVKKQLSHITQRRYFWESLFNHTDFQRLCEQQQIEQAHDFVEQHLHHHQPISGSVSLVGAGSGDAGLLTIKGLQRIQEADVVLYDALVSQDVLNLVRRDAEQIYVGKRAKHHHLKQNEINDLMLKLAQEGKRVVRLKGGDPFVFGRGGEELSVLKQAGIPFDVVPAVTAATAATAYAGIPLTHRDFSQSVTLITGCNQAEQTPESWRFLAQANQTIVVYMGAMKAFELQEQLLQHGKNPDTPVAIINKGTLPEQSVHIGTLKHLSELAKWAQSPSLMVIGETVSLHEELRWFGEYRLPQRERILQAA